MGHPNVNVRNLMGEHGFVYKSVAAAVTIPTGRRVNAIKAHADSVVNVTAADATGDPITEVNLPAGDVWHGLFTAVTLTSGEITCYLEAQR
jgi:hypothetical protein